MSGLNNYIVKLVHGISLGGLFPCVYADGIFAVLACILPRFSNPTPELHLLNVRMASLRESEEHIFASFQLRGKGAANVSCFFFLFRIVTIVLAGQDPDVLGMSRQL